MRQRTIGLLTLVVLTNLVLPLWLIHPANAAEGDELQCSSFRAQEDAQETYDSAPDVWVDLDKDGNGIACEELPERPSELDGTLAVDIRTLGPYPRVGFSDNFGGWLGGLMDPDEFPSKVECAELVNPDGFYTVFENTRQVFIEDMNGRTTGKDNGLETWLTGVVLWVWLPNGDVINSNEWILENGYGVYWDETASRELGDEWEAAEDRAREEGAGIWGECDDVRPIQDVEPEETFVSEFDLVVSGVGNDNQAFTIRQAGSYMVTIKSDSIQDYIETYVVQSDTDAEIPELSHSIFGPDEVTVEVYLERDRYVLTTAGVGGWRVEFTRIGD